MSRGRDLVFVGDVHLERDDPELPPFLAFLARLASTCERVVLMGDLFQIWIGDRELEQPQHLAVLGALRDLRARGVTVRYLEGNRDYRVGRCYTGSALDDASDRGFVEEHGGRSLYAVHGDRVNPADRQYRLWRRFSRSAPVWGAFRLLPRRSRLRLVEAVERRLRETNPAFKSSFPEAVVRAFAAPWLADGHDAVVLGHFHVERDLVADGGGRILVVPEWKGSRRHLRVGADGAIGFVDSRA